MRTKQTGFVILLCGLCFAAGLFVSPLLLPPQPTGEAPPANSLTLFPAGWQLGSVLYMQTAAEYHASCLQTYRCAAARLKELLRSRQPTHRKPAVVLDLDETVLDNSTFESFVLQNNAVYTDSLWRQFERQHWEEVKLMPGARVFIETVERNGATVVFISNRSETNRHFTVKALQNLGVNCDNIDERLFLRRSGASSDKTPRRTAVSERYQVLLYLGDNLRDFSETFAFPKLAAANNDSLMLAIQARRAQVEAARDHWGVDWFVFPNPVYGEWQKPLGEGYQMLGKLRPTAMKLARNK